MSRISFSSNVKKELAGRLAPDKTGRMAELAALFCTCGKVETDPWRLVMISEHEEILAKIRTGLEKIFRIECRTVDRNCLEIGQTEDVPFLLKSLHLIQGGLYVRHVPEELTGTQEAQQAYVRGAFLGSGSITNPHKHYHAEFMDTSLPFLEELQQMLYGFGLDMHITERIRQNRGFYVLYLKESEQIADLLNVMQAYTAMMDLVNVQIEKRVRNQINRSVNCETANLRKVVEASLRQTEAIRYLTERKGWESLPPQLAEMARIRIEYPDMSLQELGSHLEPPVSRSGVNHRLRRLVEMAEDLRKQEQEQ